MRQHNQLQQAVSLSEQILAAIDEQDLDKVARLDIDRKRLIDRYYQNTDTIDIDLTQLLKQKNDEIVSRLVDLQHQTRSQQLKLNQSQKVSKAYLDNI